MTSAATSAGRALLVATAGGHLMQLFTMAPRLGLDVEEATWVTTDTSQSRSLLKGRRVVWAPYSSPRDLRGLYRHLSLAVRVIRRADDFSIAVSTGASLAVPFLARAAQLGLATHYIESATRVDGPSLTGRLVSKIPGVSLYTQYESWDRRRWKYLGNVFDSWAAARRAESRPPRNIVVTVGGAQGYPFTAMLQALQDILPAYSDVTWQIGDAKPDGLRGRIVTQLPFAEMAALLAAADVVVSHAGIGSILTCLKAGQIPIVVPRTSANGEHVDDHQLEIARFLEGRGLAIVRSVNELAPADIVLAESLEPTPTQASEMMFR